MCLERRQRTKIRDPGTHLEPSATEARRAPNDFKLTHRRIAHSMIGLQSTSRARLGALAWCDKKKIKNTRCDETRKCTSDFGATTRNMRVPCASRRPRKTVDLRRRERGDDWWPLRTMAVGASIAARQSTFWISTRCRCAGTAIATSVLPIYNGVAFGWNLYCWIAWYADVGTCVCREQWRCVAKCGKCRMSILNI